MSAVSSQIADRTRRIKSLALSLGFDRVGITPAVTPPNLARFHEWLEAGFAGQMHYLPDRQEAYSHPAAVLEGATHMVLLAMNYATATPRDPSPGEGRVSRYAWGRDYHHLIHERLAEVISRIREYEPQARLRGVVDTAPLLEREFAVLAGLGWIGKNTMLIHPRQGSYFFLAALLTDLELECDAPLTVDHCGTCRACLDACPTGAFVQPRVLDSRRCISYLTIELRDSIPEPLRGGIGDWLFGCDVCQEVCPFNRFAPESKEIDFQPRPDGNPVPLGALFELDEASFRDRFRDTPLWRARRRGILRNAAIVLGNQRDPDAVAALKRGLNDPEPLVRAAAAWALGQIGGPQAIAALQDRRPCESSDEVRDEIAAALRHAKPSPRA